MNGVKEHLASFDSGTGVFEACRLWIPAPGKIEEPEKLVDQLSPLLAMNHLNLAKVIDVSPTDESLFIAYAYEPQRSLAQLFSAHSEQRGLFPVSLGVYVVTEILQALQFALSLGPSPIWWTHGDLIPEAIEITEHGIVRLRRLGLARALAPAVKGGGLEAIEARKRLSPGADVRAAAKMLRDLIQPIKQKVPPQLARVISHGMSPDRKKGYSDAGKLLDALAGAKDASFEDWTPERIEELLSEVAHEELETEREELAKIGRNAPKEKIPFVRQRSDVPGYIPDRTGTVPPSGAVIGERYQVIRELGQGGVGVVLEVEHLELGTRGALKMLDPDVSRDPAQVERFKREARSASRIGHPNIVRVIDLGRTEDDRFYYVMDLIRGENLGKLIAITGALDQERAIKIMLQLCDALEAAHNQNVVHRDLKPENLMLSSGPEGRDVVGVVDFGLALTLDSKDMRLTQKGFAMGTPYYMAPEQISGLETDARTDIYAAGAIFYEMLTGQTPFEEATIAEVLTAHLRKPPPPPRVRAPQRKISPGIEAVVLRALKKDPEERFQHMLDMAEAIKKARKKELLPVEINPLKPDLRFVPNSPAIPPPMSGESADGRDLVPNNSPPPAVPGPYANVGGTTPPVASPPAYPEYETQAEGVLPDPFDEKATSPAPPPVEPISDAPTFPAPPPAAVVAAEPVNDALYDVYDDEDFRPKKSGMLLFLAFGAVLVIVLGAGIGVWFYLELQSGETTGGPMLTSNTPDSAITTPLVPTNHTTPAEAGISPAEDAALDATPAPAPDVDGDTVAVDSEAGSRVVERPSTVSTPAGPSASELFDQAQTLLKQRRTADAKRVFQRVVRRSPSKAAAWAGLGQAEFEMGQHPAAARALSKAVRLNPRSVRYRLLLANALLRSGRRPEAMNEYREVLRLDPNNAVARLMVGGNSGD